MTCPSCGAVAPADARFCPSCGHALGGAGDERRVVTVLFGDLVGFTSLSEARDPERVKNLLDRCFERLAGIITAFGGRVDKIVGDALVALFGAPVAHEDDAERAVRAALRMHETLAEEATSLGEQVRMRIGVNTGEVLVGALRAGGDYTAMGDVVNTASRLQTLAPEGAVVVGPETYRATREVVRYEPVGEVEVRGRGEAVAAWRALGVLAPPGYRPHRPTTPLVGRDTELELLDRTIAGAAARRRPALVLLVGEAGVGKTRLAAELREVATRERMATVLEGRCVPYGEANVWWPVAEALRHGCGIEPDDPADVLREKTRQRVADALGRPADDPDVVHVADGLLWLMGGGGALEEIEAARAHAEAVRALRSFLQGLGEQAPTVMVLSDVQWADPIVLETLDDLLDELRTTPFVAVATTRPGLEERWAPRAGRHDLLVLHLDPLDLAAARRLLEVLLGGEAPPEVTELLLERSGGNPFYLEELAAIARESNLLVAAAEAGTDLGALPATLRGLVAARLDALPPAERALLEDLAVIGRHGPLVGIRAMAQARGVGDVDTVLESLVAKDLVRVDGREAAFRSDLVREVAYGTLTKAERARRHAAIGAWLDGRAIRAERRDEWLESLAHHYGTAALLVRELGAVPGVPDDVGERALAAVQRAAARAEERELHPAARRLFELVLDLLDESDGKARREAMIGRARALTGMHELSAARADLEAVMAEADAAGDAEDHALALTVLGEVQHHGGDYAGAAETLTRAIADWERIATNLRGLAMALRRRGLTRLFVGDREGADDDAGRALSLFREIGSRKGEAWALQHLAWIAFERGDLGIAEARLHDSAALFEEISDLTGLGWALGLLGWVRFFQGRRDEAAALAHQILDSAGEIGDRWGAAMMQGLLANVELWEGHTSEAVRLATESHQRLAELGDQWGRSQVAAVLARALTLQGRLDDARAALAELAPTDGDDPSSGPSPDLVDLLAATTLGDDVATLERIAAQAVRIAADNLPLTELAVAHALALLQVGDAAAAAGLARQILDSAGESGASANARAVAALAAAASDDVRVALELAAAVVEDRSATYRDRALALVARAGAHLRDGDHERAREDLDEAVAVVDGTDDRLDAALLRLARATALAALGDAAGDDDLVDARTRLGGLGLTAAGWETAFGLVVGDAAARRPA